MMVSDSVCHVVGAGTCGDSCFESVVINHPKNLEWIRRKSTQMFFVLKKILQSCS